MGGLSTWLEIDPSRALSALRKIIGAADRTGRKVSGLNRQANRLFKGVTAAVIVNELKKLTRAAGQASLALESIQRSARVTGADLGFLETEADRLGVSFSKTANRFGQLAISFEQAGLTGRDVEDVFTAVSEASSVLALGSEKTELALLAIQQIASKNVVSMEELRQQLGEQIPGALGLMAKGLDVSIPKLIEMVESGQLLAKDALPALAREMRAAFADGVTEAIDSRQAAIGRLDNSWFKLKATLGDTLPIKAAATAVTDLAKNTETLVIALKKVSDDDSVGNAFRFLASGAPGIGQLANQLQQAEDGISELADTAAILSGQWDRLEDSQDTAETSATTLTSTVDLLKKRLSETSKPLIDISDLLADVKAAEAEKEISDLAASMGKLLGETAPGAEVLRELARSMIEEEAAAKRSSEALKANREETERLRQEAERARSALMALVDGIFEERALVQARAAKTLSDALKSLQNSDPSGLSESLGIIASMRAKEFERLEIMRLIESDTETFIRLQKQSFDLQNKHNLTEEERLAWLKKQTEELRLQGSASVASAFRDGLFGAADSWSERMKDAAPEIGAVLGRALADVVSVLLNDILNDNRPEGRLGGRLSSDLSQPFSGIGSSAGGAIGFSLGGPLGAAAGEIIGSEIGDFLGGLFQHGADEALATIQQLGQDAVTTITKDEGGLGSVLEQIGSAVSAAISGLEDLLGGDINIGEIGLKVRDDLISVFAFGMTRTFESIEEAIQFAAAQAVKSAGEVSGLSPEVAAAINNFTGDTLNELQRSIAVALDVSRLGIPQSVLSLRDETDKYFDLLAELPSRLGGLGLDRVLDSITGSTISAYNSLFGVQEDQAAAKRAEAALLHAEVLAITAKLKAEEQGLLGSIAAAQGQAEVDQFLQESSIAASQGVAAFAQTMAGTAEVAGASVESLMARLAAVQGAIAALEGLDFSPEAINQLINNLGNVGNIGGVGSFSPSGPSELEQAMALLASTLESARARVTETTEALQTVQSAFEDGKIGAEEYGRVVSEFAQELQDSSLGLAGQIFDLIGESGKASEVAAIQEQLRVELLVLELKILQEQAVALGNLDDSTLQIIEDAIALGLAFDSAAQAMEDFAAASQQRVLDIFESLNQLIESAGASGPAGDIQSLVDNYFEIFNEAIVKLGTVTDEEFQQILSLLEEGAAATIEKIQGIASSFLGNIIETELQRQIDNASNDAERLALEQELFEFQKQRMEIERAFQIAEIALIEQQLIAFGALTPEIAEWIERSRELLLLPLPEFESTIVGAGQAFAQQVSESLSGFGTGTPADDTFGLLTELFGLLNPAGTTGGLTSPLLQQLQAMLAEFENLAAFIPTFAGQFPGLENIDQVTSAIQQLIEIEQEALELQQVQSSGLIDLFEELTGGSLSGLTPFEQAQALQGNLDDLIARAQAGDLSVLPDLVNAWQQLISLSADTLGGAGEADQAAQIAALIQSLGVPGIPPAGGIVLGPGGGPVTPGPRGVSVGGNNIPLPTPFGGTNGPSSAQLEASMTVPLLGGLQLQTDLLQAQLSKANDTLLRLEANQNAVGFRRATPR